MFGKVTKILPSMGVHFIIISQAIHIHLRYFSLCVLYFTRKIRENGMYVMVKGNKQVCLKKRGFRGHIMVIDHLRAAPEGPARTFERKNFLMIQTHEMGLRAQPFLGLCNPRPG